MPVVFLCHNCRSRLKITRRKIGTQIECPRCQAAVVVPTQEAANASLAMAEAEAPPVDLFPQLAVFDEPPPRAATSPAMVVPPPPPLASLKSSPAPPKPDKPSRKRAKEERKPIPPPEPQPRSRGRQSGDVESPPREAKAHTNGAAPHAPAAGPLIQPAPSASSRAPAPPARPRPTGKLLISRRVVYFQAGLICLLAVFGLWGGFLIGRAVGPVGKSTSTAAKEPTYEIVGSIKYRSVTGDALADWQAIAIALPADKNAAIPVDGLGPKAARDAGHRGETAIEELGGAYARTSPTGNFSLRLPRPGRYHLLLISNKAERAKDRKIADNDMQQMRRYFPSPEGLVGQSRYLWVTYEVQDRLTVPHVF